jgi:two-component system chemotaxis response regulator CheB
VSTTSLGQPRGVIVIGASAGGVDALKQLASGLPSELPYSVLVVRHMAAGTPSVLARIIDRSGPLPAQQAVDGEHLRPGRIYVAVPDRHLLVDDHRAVVSKGPTEDGFRPAINPLLRSAAMAYGPCAVGVLLSGVLDDGVLGLAAIRSRGGVTVVQDPDDALFPDMPRNALAAQTVDHEVTAKGAGRLLADLVQRPCEETAMKPDPAMELENRIAMGPRFSDVFDAENLGPPSGYTCPDCSGSLMAVGATSYRCRWTCMDPGGPLPGAGQGDGECPSGGVAQPGGEGQVVPQACGRRRAGRIAASLCGDRPRGRACRCNPQRPSHRGGLRMTESAE